MKTRSSCQSGFSLVELTIALGVVVFCLVTVLGLLAVGINTTHGSTTQTSATNILNAVAADLESAPNITAASGTTTAKGAGTTAYTSFVYGMSVPPGSTSTTATTTAQPPIYIGDDGQVVTTAAAGTYRLTYWTTPSALPTQETLVRIVISWPAASAYTTAQGYVESVVAINRT